MDMFPERSTFPTPCSLYSPSSSPSPQLCWFLARPTIAILSRSVPPTSATKHTTTASSSASSPPVPPASITGLSSPATPTFALHISAKLCTPRTATWRPPSRSPRETSASKTLNSTARTRSTTKNFARMITSSSSTTRSSSRETRTSLRRSRTQRLTYTLPQSTFSPTFQRTAKSSETPKEAPSSSLPAPTVTANSSQSILSTSSVVISKNSRRSTFLPPNAPPSSLTSRTAKSTSRASSSTSTARRSPSFARRCSTSSMRTASRSRIPRCAGIFLSRAS
mmetsp:Transcript_14578/g.37252  ORF Transcript_14578/g.37252 Transcript_14578/m.37252 type:complete len:280 (-) Transcript_14578:1672-2511(-)